MCLKKSILFCFFLILCFSLSAQKVSLCGIWFGYGYQAQTSSTIYNVPVEIISITQEGNYAIATKVVGDDCVTSGNITWEGYDTGSVFPVQIVAGNPETPNCCEMTISMQIIDSTHVQAFYGSPRYVKATCAQIDSMAYLFNNVDIGCTTCPILFLPNVFTPNNDGINDVFAPAVSKNITSYTLEIYNRWGNEVFSSNNSAVGWDGKTGSGEASTGTYYYTCIYSSTSGEVQYKNGFLELIR